MTEDERMLAAVDFGFGYQDPKFGGTVGLSPYHMDIMLATPTVYLDDKEMSGGGKLNHELGFEQMLFSYDTQPGSQTPVWEPG